MRTVRDFGATGDGVTDDTAAIQHAIDQGVQELYFPPGDYLITAPIRVDLASTGRLGASGSGGTAKVIMAGPGPAFDLTGSHNRSADPGGFSDQVWARERMPTIAHLEIEGRHEEADGIRVEKTMQTTFTGLLLRELRHGIHVVHRARNVLIDHCHIYHNRGIGIFFDHTDLHQVIISDSHISYNRLGGFKILNGAVRNVQVTGNDIEYNYDRAAGEEAPASAEIWIETSAEGATIREGTIASNTIQSRYSPGGANIVMIGRSAKENHKAGMFAIAGNLIGSQEVNVKLVACRAVTVSGNVIYSGHKRNVHAVDCRNIVVTGNSFDHNPDYLPDELATGVTFERCTDSLFAVNTVQDAQAGKHTVNTPVDPARMGLVELLDCTRVTVNGCQVLDGAGHGLYVRGGRGISVTGCTITDTRPEPMMDHAIKWDGAGQGNLVTGCILGGGTGAAIDAAAEAGVRAEGNVEESPGGVA